MQRALPRDFESFVDFEFVTGIRSCTVGVHYMWPSGWFLLRAVAPLAIFDDPLTVHE